MLTQTKNPALAAPGLKNNSQTNNSATPLKWQRITHAFREGRSLNRFEAERIGDHALHSTVSALERRGLTILRRWETVPGFMGTRARVCRYWLCPESHQRASELLGHARTPTGGADALQALPEEARHGAAPAQE